MTIRPAPRPSPFLPYILKAYPEYFIGIVVNDRDDSTMTGRVQIWIRGVHPTDIAEQELPWASVVTSTSSAGVGGRGNSSLDVEIGAQVFGIFLDSEKQHPLVLGVINHLDFTDGNNDTNTASGRRYGNVTGGNVNIEGKGQIAESALWDWLVDYLANEEGLTAEHARRVAAGVLANINAESSYSTTIEGDGGAALGLFQWRDSRRLGEKGLEKWCKANKFDPYSAKGQLEFFKYENSTTESLTWNETKKATSPGKAARVFCIGWERPEDKQGDAAEREGIAGTLYTRYKDRFVAFVDTKGSTPSTIESGRPS